MTLPFIRNHWFMLGLIAVALVTLGDQGQYTSSIGVWLGSHKGPETMIVLIFLFSGLALDTAHIRAGVADVRGTLVTLALIFVVSPLVTLFFGLLPLSQGIVIGLFLVGAMPSTLSSGVVMTGAAGGNTAHSLLITVIANIMAVVTVPIVLGLLLRSTGESRLIEIDQLAIMAKITTLVLFPLVIGLVWRRLVGKSVKPLLPAASICNQLAVLVIVWMALASGRGAIINELNSMATILLLVIVYHLSLLLLCLLATRISGLAKGRRESVIFMGGQKTLPLSVILQVSLFPEFGLALVVCVLHHIVHLVIDAYLIHYLQKLET